MWPNWTPFASGCGELLKTELREVERDKPTQPEPSA
jgi:hypothetical protein